MKKRKYTLTDQIKETFPIISLVSLARQIESNLVGCKTILDVGCGDNSPIRLLTKQYTSTGIDGFAKSIEDSKKKKIHSKYIKMDVRKLTDKFKPKSFDAVMALDLIEHLKKNDGKKLLKDMEAVAKKRVILVTPNGFIPQHNAQNNLQEHLSGWTVEDFKKHGYKVQGIYGLKQLRKEEGELAFKPKFLWGLISEASHYLFTKYFPKYSFSLMATKELD